MKTTRRLVKPLGQTLSKSCRLKLAAENTHVNSFDEGVVLLGMLIRRHRDPFELREQVDVFVDPAQVRQIFVEIDAWCDGLKPDANLAREFQKFNQRLRGWFQGLQYAYDAPQAYTAIDYYLFRSTRTRLKEIRGCSSSQLQAEHHRYLESGHETWQWNGEALLVLSSLQRSVFRLGRKSLPWEADEVKPLPPFTPTGQPAG